MEGTTEVNNETPESPRDSSQLKNKETEQPGPTCQPAGGPVQSAGPNANERLAQLDPDWPEHFSFLRSSDDNLTAGTASISAHQEQEVMVEELTLKSYRGTSASLSVGSSSSSGGERERERPPIRKGLWGNFTRLAGATRNLNAVDLRSALSNTMAQSSSGFAQIVAKNAPKGKEVAFKGLDMDSNSNLSHKKCTKDDTKPLFGGGGGVLDSNSSKSEGVNLREILKQRNQRLSKNSKMQIFKQIVELLDISHSQGLALRYLRPSYFTILPLNQVRYTGGFIPQDLTGTGAGMVQIEDQFSRKRCLDLKKERETAVSKFKYKKIGEQGAFRSRNTGCDFRENLKFGDLGKFEDRWYTSPEEQSEPLCPFASNVYSLGVLLFEIFCYFETWEVHCAAMSDLRQRILPPNFLLENPKETGFCLWLLHPDPTSRPKARDILQCDLITEGQQESSPLLLDPPAVSFEESESESESEILVQFLSKLKEQKEKQAAKLAANLSCLQADITEVERRYSYKSAQKEVFTPKPSIYEERLMRNMEHLEKAYNSMRSQIDTSAGETAVARRSDNDVLKLRENFHCRSQGDPVISPEEGDMLGTFFEDLCKYARYNRFEVRGVLKNSDMLSGTNVICSLSFDRDEEYFAAAGMAKKIKIFEFESLLNDGVDIHYPLIEMPSRSRLSCVCWNGYIKNYLASTDYDGVVQLWDASTGQGFTHFMEHRKRAWSVNFSHVDPTKLASGSDDCTVKIWSINERNSVNTVRSMANVCCVQYSPYSSHLLAIGSADYKIYCYDLRNTRVPWCTLSGHSKAVSYVRFLDSSTLVSASTDNSLKIWDLNRTHPTGVSSSACRLTLTGHTNEKNFVGLSVCDGYIACGSETNDVYAYYRAFPMPITSHRFGSTDPITGQETGDDNSQFVSSVCWRGRSNMVVSANSSGSIKVLQLV